MSRKNAYAVKLKNDRSERIIIHTQMCLDAAMMAANDVFNMGESRCQEFASRFSHYVAEIAQTTIEDSRDMEYTKERIDNRLRAICGKHFVPYEVRYGRKGNKT